MITKTLPAITFNKVTFGFGEEQIFYNFSFKAPAGHHTVLKGESGSGKSTLLQLLLGFHKPEAGTISFNASDDNPSAIRKKTAWLPQDLNLGSGSVAEVMAKPFEFATNRSSQQQNFASRRDKTLAKLGLTKEILQKQFRDLSTGQRQRVGLGICYLLNKPLLLLDEPTSALDKVSKQKVAELLLNERRTVISTSHDPFWVAKANNVIEL